MRVERFMLFFPPIVWSTKRGETEYGVGCIPLGGYVKITGMTAREELPEEYAYRAYHLQAPWKRIAVILAGPLMNVLIAFAILWGISAFSDRYESTNRVAEVSKGAPAAEVLQAGDTIVAVDGVRGKPERLREQLSTHKCPGEQTDGCTGTPVRLTIERGGRTLTVTASPKYSAEAKRPLLGFTFDAVPVDEDAIQALGTAADEMWRVTDGTVTAITRLFYSSEARKEVSGVVGSYETTRQAIGLSTTAALYILAVISLSLAIVNLFPFLPLDGGHVFWAIAEKIRGKAIPFAVMERAGIVGFLLVAFLFLIGLTNDIDRLRGEGFGIR